MRRASLLIAALLCAGPNASAGGDPPVGPTPEARLPAGDDASEHWDLAAHFESGHRLYVRFLVTNSGPGDRTALAFGHLLRPDGPPVPFRNGRQEGRWQLSEDRRQLTIGSSVLTLGEALRHFEVDNDKRGIKIQLSFPGDATARSAPAAPGGYQLDLLNLATPASGSFWLEGMAEPRPLAGHAVLTHTWFRSAESKLLARRIDVAGFDPGARIFLSELLTPDGGVWRWGVMGDHRVAPVPELSIATSGAGAGDYPVPKALEVRGKGLNGGFSLGKTLLEVDPIDALPTLVRMVYSFGGRPRQLWVEADADVGIKSPDGNAVLRYQGEGIATLVYPDRLPPSDR